MPSHSNQPNRVVSGMRASGALHLGHYHGVLKNWLRLQHEMECLFFVADWHALTTHYETPEAIADTAINMVVEWLAVGVDPRQSKIFIQSQVPEHAELHLLLSMITPLGWLERVPTYKDQQEKLKERDLSTYGFLGYPLLQSADILIYNATLVPVGEDQVPHVELTREIARRFNHLFGREPGFETKAADAIRKMGKKSAKLFHDLRRRYQEKGEEEALEVARALVEDQKNLTLSDRDRLLGYLEGGGRIILVEPEALLTKAARMPGLDGNKMSKSYGNTIALRESPEDVDRKIRTMPTDPQRVRRDDPGEPDKCPVWPLHQVYSSADVRDWVQNGCRSAGIGCIDCKRPLIDAIHAELAPIQARIKELDQDPDQVRGILREGAEEARELAQETLFDVRKAMGLDYR
ncbi:MAG: tryptophan--tRNA ligase [Pseudomonadota bacterium]|nr:tryptophan--tRNA ligase [Pseudomonadota bacterium]